MIQCKVKVLLRYKWALMLSLLLLFILERCHCLLIIHICTVCYMTQFTTDLWFSKHLMMFIKFYLQTPNTRNLCFIIYQGVLIKSNNIIQLWSRSMHYTARTKFVLQWWGKVLSPFLKQSMQLMYFRTLQIETYLFFLE